MPHPSSSSSESGSEDRNAQEEEEKTRVLFQPFFHPTRRTIEFSVDRIQSQLTCCLCRGFFRDPFTTAKCHHTFCRGCLGISFRVGNYDCPSCQTYLGTDIEKAGALDHVLNDLMDKILFPQLAHEDRKRENDFYLRRGIDTKLASPARADPTSTQRPKKRLRSYSSKIMVELIPDPKTTIPPLEHPLIYSENTLRIGQIKKYLTHQFESANKPTPHKWQISCHETPLGDELNLVFVLRTVWREPVKMLQLVYTEQKLG